MVPGHVLLCLYKISRIFHTFLSVVHELKRSQCRRNPFQCLTTNFAQLPGLNHHSHSTGLSCDPSRPLTGDIEGAKSGGYRSTSQPFFATIPNVRHAV